MSLIFFILTVFFSMQLPVQAVQLSEVGVLVNSRSACLSFLTRSSREKSALQIIEAYRIIVLKNLDQTLRRSDLEAMLSTADAFAIERKDSSELQLLRQGLSQLAKFSAENVRDKEALRTDLLRLIKEIIDEQDSGASKQREAQQNRQTVTPLFRTTSAKSLKGSVNHLALSEDAKTMAAVSGKEILLIETATGAQIQKIRNDFNTFDELPDNEVKISTDSSTLFILSDQRLLTWDIKSGKRQTPIKELMIEEIEKGVKKSYYLPVDSIDARGGLFAASAREVLYLYSTEGGLKLKHSFKNDFDSWWSTTAISPDGKVLLASSGETITAWDTESGEQLYSTKLPQSKVVGNFNFVEGSAKLVVSSADSTGKVIAVLGVKTGAVLKNLTSVQGLSSGETQASADGKWLAVSTHSSCMIWDLKSGNSLFDLKKTFENGLTRYFDNLVFLPDSDWILIQAIGGESTFFNLVTKKQIKEKRADNNSPNTGVILYEQRQFITVTQQNEIRTWDMSQLEDEALQSDMSSK